MSRYQLIVACFIVAPLVGTPPGLFAAEPSSATIKGRVIDPDGKPISARVRIAYPPTVHDLVGRFFKRESLSAIANAKGEFELTPRDGWDMGVVIAEADGFGPTWQSLKVAQHEDYLTLQLAKNSQIVGRVMDSNGRPVPDAQITLQSVHRFHDENVEAFLKMYRDNPLDLDSFIDTKSITALSYIKTPNRFRTDQDGNFTVPNIGANRVVRLDVRAEGYLKTGMWVVTRKLGAKWQRTKLDEQTRIRMEIGSPLPIVYSQQFTHVTLPTVTIAGIVVNRETQEPMANVGVVATGRRDLHGYAFTNKDGRFEIDGLPTEAVFDLKAMRPPAYVNMLKNMNRPRPMPFMSESKRGLTYGPATPLPLQKFELSPAFTVSGRLVNDSGLPVKNATVYYVATADNKAGLALHDELEESEEKTNADGRFELPVLPGPGLLLVSAGGGKYQPASAADVPLPQRDGAPGQIVVFNRRVIMPELYEDVTLISPSPDENDIHVNLQVTTMHKVEVKILDRNGKPVAGTTIENLHGPTPFLGGKRLIESIAIALPSPTSETPIIAAVRHDERKIGGIVLMTAGNKQSDTEEVRLRPYGTLAGRFVRNGKPISNLDFTVTVEDNALAVVRKRTGRELNNVLVQGKADRNGRFRIPDFICGQRVKIVGTQSADNRDGEVETGRRQLISKTLVLRSGEFRDLGDLECAP